MQIKTFINWRPIAEYKNTGNTMRIDGEPEVMLWHPRYGTSFGKCLRWSDGEVITVGGGHGFSYTHFAEFNTPTDR